MAFLSASRSNEVLYSLSAAVATGTGTTAQTLASYSLPANALRRNGQALRILAWGTTAANGNNKTVELDFGSAAAVSSGVLAANNKPWFLEACVIRRGSATQSIRGGGQANAAIIAEAHTAGTEDLTAAVTIAMKATDGTSSAGDVQLEGMLIEGLSD